MQLLASGREADVYDLGSGRVLRRSRHTADTTAEAEVMVRLARHGFPVPAVYEATGPDLIMQRVAGPSMLTALCAGDMDVADAAATLADLHHRLHEIPVGAERILHLDLHPDNVLLGPDGPVVIDWTNSVEGSPALDTAVSALILAQVAVGGTELAGLADDLLRAFGPAVDAVTELAEALRLRRANPSMTERELAELDQAAELVRQVTGAQITGVLSPEL
ncbi:phosphotransferase [Kutzneria sp. CA-103260]|uniref:phosphotransferase n=1 Tax=Kutzneria sp. CA-103260 TaxID=2802641 RepID=UPI001BAB11D1|nr:phosphotransferase [Kutzneria sp. CA-103260]QUQ63112.1 aminoglycoside phosphotransferase [Kutzneria sp. CA-103260]